MAVLIAAVHAHLLAGQVIPAHPLALTAQRKLDERRQRALTRYYIDAGAGGIAVGVHTTQFAIREPQHGLYRPVLELAAETARGVARRDAAPVRARRRRGRRHAAGGRRSGDRRGARLRRRPAQPRRACHGERRGAHRALPRRRGGAAAVRILSAARGGRPRAELRFWRAFAEIENVWAIKIAPFNRYQTLDVVRAVADAGRDDIALYTGNDDNIVLDLLTPFPGDVGGARQRAASSAGCWASGRCGRAAPSSCSSDARRARRRRSTRAVCATGRRSPTPTARSSTRRTPSPDASRHSRGAAPPGAARRHLVPRSVRDALARPGRGDRSRVSCVS